ncbi:hypothetical protein [Luteibacter sp. SG786]|uniref:hypothetical protein n=1 Tax=Luteibacter sp. SG786 TaxID=2587130 RepID=UPI0014221752|nr:hypothetical protein [Luteibacter sp. SG786]NII53793.1 hypothetical protein [Luteibacter sp. SG786]
MSRQTLAGAAHILLLWLAAGVTHADTPLEPANETAFCSKEGRYCAHSTVNPPHLEVFARRNPEDVLWSRNESVTKGFLSDDGKTVVSCYGGLNLIPLDATLEFPVVRMLHASGNVEEIRLKLLYSDIRQLPRTGSHLEWGRCVGIEGGNALLERADGTQWQSSKL